MGVENINELFMQWKEEVMTPLDAVPAQCFVAGGKTSRRSMPVLDISRHILPPDGA